MKLSKKEIDAYYHHFSNSILWPLFHYFIDRLPLDAEGWDLYSEVNKKFADAVCQVYQPGDMIWVHDIHLMLLPQLLRERHPTAKIGFFLHIPFPTSEIFRILPWREPILEGLLGADLIGFHTDSYLRHFSSSLTRILGLDIDFNRAFISGREIKLGAYPMGINARFFDDLKTKSSQSKKDRQLILAVDRLDYTKGIPNRLLAFEKLLESHPELRGQVTLMQIAVPSRMDNPSFEAVKRQVDEMVGRLNGLYGNVDHAPVHYINRAFSPDTLVEFFRSADCMMVTPLRDGMNLVAKEFVASRSDERGVLVLSEFAGSSSELGEALLVNPFDANGVGQTLYRALTMPDEEQAVRMRKLRKRVLTFDIFRWAETFLYDLEQVHEGHLQQTDLPENISPIDLGTRMKNANDLVIFLDYDGTMMPFHDLPELASPDAELLELLKNLAAKPRAEIHIVSGRAQETIGKWLGHLPLFIHAEHGLWSKPPASDQWKSLIDLDQTEWKKKVWSILEFYTLRTPGSLIEDKSFSIAWHYRMADPEFGLRQARELKFTLTSALSNTPLEVLQGSKVLEVRHSRVKKSAIVPAILKNKPDDVLTIAFGDDLTDEDLFAVIPVKGLTVHVGNTPSRAKYRLPDTSAVRQVLKIAAS